MRIKSFKTNVTSPKHHQKRDNSGFHQIQKLLEQNPIAQNRTKSENSKIAQKIQKIKSISITHFKPSNVGAYLNFFHQNLTFKLTNHPLNTK